MNQLKDIIASIEEKEAEAAVHPEEVNPNVRAGVEAMVRNAKAALEKIYTEYRDAVMNHVVVIGVTGTTAQEFAEKAESLGAVAIDFNLIKTRLCKSLKDSALGEFYTSNAHIRLITELGQIRTEYNMVQLPVPQINGYNDGIYDAPIPEALDKLLDKCYGSALQSAVTRREIGKKALVLRFVGQKLPVVVYNLDRDVETRFLPAPVSTITSNKEVTDENVKKELTKVKKLLNQKSNTDGQETAQQGE